MQLCINTKFLYSLYFFFSQQTCLLKRRKIKKKYADFNKKIYFSLSQLNLKTKGKKYLC